MYLGYRAAMMEKDSRGISWSPKWPKWFVVYTDCGDSDGTVIITVAVRWAAWPTPRQRKDYEMSENCNLWRCNGHVMSEISLIIIECHSSETLIFVAVNIVPDGVPHVRNQTFFLHRQPKRRRILRNLMSARLVQEPSVAILCSLILALV